MKPSFDRYGIEVVMLSTDPPDKARLMRKRDDLDCRLLCDPQLEVIDRFGLRHRGSPIAKTYWVFGIPLGMITGFADMAIPTTLLLDEHGVVRWIDQADDYRIRGDAQRIECALADSFQPLAPGKTPGMAPS